MTGYVLVEKGKDRPIAIEIEEQDTLKDVSIIVFEYKKDIIKLGLVEENEEIKKVEIKIL